MFTFTDDNWNRKELYEIFLGYTYTVTVDIDVTNLREKTKAGGYKFYPSICWCIGKTVNSDKDFRFARFDNKPGYFDKLKLHYNLLRNDGSECFTHALIDFNDDFKIHYDTFEKAKSSAEKCGRLYDFETPVYDCVHISTFPKISPTAISVTKPDRYSGYNKPDTAFVPFVIVGMFREVNGRLLCPVTGEFHHCVNDGFHAQKFMLGLQKAVNEFDI